MELSLAGYNLEIHTAAQSEALNENKTEQLIT